MKLSFECDKRWDDLEGTSNRRRHCGDCDQSVYNISSMSRSEAEKLVSRGKICVHFASVDGSIVHKGSRAERLLAQRVGVRELVLAGIASLPMFMVGAGTPIPSISDLEPAEATQLASEFLDSLSVGRSQEAKFTMGNNSIDRELVF